RQAPRLWGFARIAHASVGRHAWILLLWGRHDGGAVVRLQEAFQTRDACLRATLLVGAARRVENDAPPRPPPPSSTSTAWWSVTFPAPKAQGSRRSAVDTFARGDSPARVPTKAAGIPRDESRS